MSKFVIKIKGDQIRMLYNEKIIAVLDPVLGKPNTITRWSNIEYVEGRGWTVFIQDEMYGPIFVSRSEALEYERWLYRHIDHIFNNMKGTIAHVHH